MTSTYTGTPSDTAPYLEIMRKDFPTKPGYPIAIYPKLAGRPAKMKFSDDLSVMALVSYLRRENMAGIGNPTETPPTSGIRVFNYNDRFLFLGGNSSQAPVLYERAGPVYQNTNLLAMPSGQYAIAAAFSRGGKYLFVVWSGTPNRVDVYSWTGTDAKDPAGAWTVHSTLNQPGAVQTLYVSSGNKYLIASQSAAMAVYTIEPLAPVYTASSRFLDMDKAETKFAALNSGGSVEMRAATDGAVQQTLAGSTWNPSSSGIFDVDDDNCFVMAGRAATGGASPITYAFDSVESQWVFSYGESRASLTGLNLRNLDAVSGKIAAGLSASAEIYKRQEISPDPLTPVSSVYTGFSAPAYVRQSTDGSVIAFRYSGGAALAFRRSGDTLTPITGMPTGAAGDVSVSPDGLYIGVSIGTSTTIYSVSGNAVSSPMVLPDNGFNGSVYGLGVSLGALRVAIVRRNSGSSDRVVSFYSRSGSSYSLTQSVVISTSSTDPYPNIASILFHPQSLDRMVINPQANSNYSSIYFIFSSLWVDSTSTLPRPPTFTQKLSYMTFSPDGSAAYAVRAAVNTFKLMIVDLGPLTPIFESQTLTINGDPLALAFSAAGEGLAIGQTPNVALGVVLMRVFGRNSAGWAEYSVPGLVNTGGARQILWTADRLDVVAGSASLSWEWSRMKSYPGYVLDVTQAFANATRVEFSPLGEILHMNDAATNIHRRMATGATIPALAFVPDFPASQVSNVQYSPTGKVVIADSPDGLELAVSQSGGGDFLNSKNVSGTFVSLYDLNESARRFTERGFVAHVSGSNVFDIVFSPEMNVFAYHVILGDTGVPTSNQGRILYDITGDGDAARYDYRGHIWDPDLLRTFIAFSPDEDYFALTEERDTGLNDILLGKFAANFFYTIEDTKPVAFGPPAFSHCDDVLVAHGGTPPFSFFKHVKATEDLVPRAMDVIDWTNTGIVLDVKWNATCTGLVLITKDRIISIEIDNGTDEATVDQDVPLDEEIPDGEEDDVTIRWPSDTDDIEIVPGMPTSGFPGSYSPPDDGIVGISYIPYCVVSVSFRVTPVAR